MNTNTLFNIYQSYTLTKVSELNKQTLVALYAQNEQLNKLNEELARSNRTTEQILRNQIKEIELQEKHRYFKNMTFNLSQAMTLLENEEYVNFRIFASSLFLSPIRDLAKDAVQELDEIADKEYAQNIVKRANTLTENDKVFFDSYSNTPWASFLSLRSQIEGDINSNKKKRRQVEERLNKCKNFLSKANASRSKRDKEKREINKEINIRQKKGCIFSFLTITMLLSLFTFGTYLTGDYNLTKGGVVLLIISILTYISPFVLKYLAPPSNYSKQAKTLRGNETVDDTKEEMVNDVAALSQELIDCEQEETILTTKYNELLQTITADYPKWENKLSEIATYILHEEKDDHKDPLLSEAAKLIVKKKDASVSLIQRKFAIGYNRAGRIMDQLEDLGIVGPTNGIKPRELLCKSEEELSELLN